MEEIEKILGEDLQEFRSMMKGLFAADEGLLADVDSMVLSHGGKQLRPIFLLLVARICGNGNPGDARVLATATELLHNATLLHDDVADGSLLRRGNPTVNALYGPSAAVLIGDHWLAHAFEIMQHCSNPLKCMDIYASILSDLARGEMFQLEKGIAADTTEEDYLKIIYCKTASLFENSCRLGSIAAGASAEETDNAAGFGRAYGLAFQIRDDIFDYLPSPHTGKPSGIDILEHKITLPLLGAIKNSGRDAEIREKVLQIDGEGALADEIRRFVLENDGIAYASRVLDEHISRALSYLERLRPCQEREILKKLAMHNAIREN